MDKISEQNFISEVHKKTDLTQYIQAIFADRKIGPLDFLPLANYCIKLTDTGIPSFKAFRRLERLWTLLKFLLFSLENAKGSIAECGVLKGFSATAMNILMSEIKKLRNEKLVDIWLIDSFEGLSEPEEEDWILIKSDKNENSFYGPSMQKGHFATPLEEVEKHFLNSKNVKLIKGWIPDVFITLPEEKWAFVHIDVDLYKPIKDSLNYFYPRMSKGGVIINDDFGSPLFPGAAKAWDEFFKEKNEGYAILDTGQAVFIKK
jgi:hypothetical protein